MPFNSTLSKQKYLRNSKTLCTTPALPQLQNRTKVPNKIFNKTIWFSWLIVTKWESQLSFEKPKITSSLLFSKLSSLVQTVLSFFLRNSSKPRHFFTATERHFHNLRHQLKFNLTHVAALEALKAPLVALSHSKPLFEKATFTN